MAPQPKADEYKIDDQEMKSYGDLLKVEDVNSDVFKKLIREP